MTALRLKVFMVSTTKLLLSVKPPPVPTKMPQLTAMELLLRSTLLPLTTMLTIMKPHLLNTKPLLTTKLPLLTTPPKRSSPPMRQRPRLQLVFTMLLLLMRPFFLPPFPRTKVKNVKLVALMAVEVVAVAAMDVAITPEDEVVGADKEEGNKAVDKVADKAAETSEVR